MAIAEPEKLTNTVFFPFFFRRARTSRWMAGNSISVRSPPLNPGSDTRMDSPSNRGEIPPAKITTSALCNLFRISRASIGVCFAKSKFSAGLSLT